VSLDQLAAMTGQSDYRRDRWGRPLIKQLDGTHLPYTRASSATKIIEDEYNLNRWHRRNGIYGMAHDASLVARTLAIGGTPDTWDLAEKKALDKIVTDADTVAKAHKGADIGTAVHRIIERVNAGETVDAGPYQADVDAYLAAVERAGLVVLPQFLEVRMVCDPLHLAGTADNIMSRGNGDPYVIADLKTGATVTYGGLGFAGQLAAYANGLLYDVEHEQRLSTPVINGDVGYIIHLPAGQGRCDIYTVDLHAGWQAAQCAVQARRHQKAAKKWLTPILAQPSPSLTPNGAEPSEPSTNDPPSGGSWKPSTPTTSTSTTKPTPQRSVLVDRVRTLVDAGHALRLANQWPDGIPGFKSDHDHTADELAAILTAVRQLEDELSMPWNPADDTTEPFVASNLELDRPNPRLAPAIDEGPPIDDATYAALKERHAALGNPPHLEQLAAEANNAGVGFSLARVQSTRRYHIVRGLVAWTEAGWDEDVVRDIVDFVTDIKWRINHPDVTLGAVIGSLELKEAETFAELAQLVANGEASLIHNNHWHVTPAA
jgi:hypothetical protein